MAAAPGDLTFDPNDNTRRRDEWARRLQLLLTFKTPELLHFKTEPSIQRHKTAVSVRFGLAKNRVFVTGFDNRNNTSGSGSGGSGSGSGSGSSSSGKVKVKLNVRYLLKRCLHDSDSWPEALYNQVAADWHELMLLQRIMRPSIDRLMTGGAIGRHTTATISHTRPSARNP